MSLTIKVAKPKNMQVLFSKAKNDAKKHNISWAGDIQQGHGTGFGFEASYTVDTDYITICVLKKPPLVSKALIERKIKEYLSICG